MPNKPKNLPASFNTHYGGGQRSSNQQKAEAAKREMKHQQVKVFEEGR